MRREQNRLITHIKDELEYMETKKRLDRSYEERYKERRSEK